MWIKNLCSGNEGNISVRLNNNHILCTPTLICKGFMKPNDLCVVDLNGNKIYGKKNATSEIKLHLEIYRAKPEINAVIHAHPPYLNAFALTGKKIPQGVIPELELYVGQIPYASFEPPGTHEVARSVLKYLDSSHMAILQHHGAVSWSTNLEEASFRMEMAESSCKTLLLAKLLGGHKLIPADKYKIMKTMKKQ
jgi:L-fuculose-phosphate aldolase